MMMMMMMIVVVAVAMFMAVGGDLLRLVSFWLRWLRRLLFLRKMYDYSSIFACDCCCCYCE
jgi:hypothetical protein